VVLQAYVFLYMAPRYQIKKAIGFFMSFFKISLEVLTVAVDLPSRQRSRQVVLLFDYRTVIWIIECLLLSHLTSLIVIY
jgi:hypothetical protein